jgi:hypothetical protein
MYLSILGGALYGVLVALPLVCTVSLPFHFLSRQPD